MSERPVLRVVSGDATPEEIAAVVAAVALTSGAAGPASGSASGPDRDGGTSLWSAYGYAHRNIRAAFAPSEHGWRTSFWPR